MNFALRACRYAAAILFIAAMLPLLAQSDGTIHLAGTVEGATGKHSIYVALWDENGFLKKPVQQVRIPPNIVARFSFNVPKGTWALSAFEDINDNGVLDMGMFGPKEPSGFGRPFHAWRKPRFDDVAAAFDKDTTDVTIKLKR